MAAPGMGWPALSRCGGAKCGSNIGDQVVLGQVHILLLGQTQQAYLGMLIDQAAPIMASAGYFRLVTIELKS